MGQEDFEAGQPRIISALKQFQGLGGPMVSGTFSRAMAIDHRRMRSSFWPYELELLALWLAWASGWSVTHGSAWSDIIVASLLWWLGCAVIGGIVVSIHTRKVKT